MKRVRRTGRRVGLHRGRIGFFRLSHREPEEKGCPIWCSSDPSVPGRRRFHRWNETGERDGGYRILECSKCGVRREAPNEWGSHFIN